MTTDKLFHPYQIISSTNTSLQLKAGKTVNVVRIAFVVAPLILLIVGIALYITQKQAFFLYAFGGIAVLEFIIFSFIQLPADVQMDRMGFALQLVSIKGSKQKEYLWADVDAILQQVMHTKNGSVLNYQAVLKSGKKVRFLSFPNYRSKKESISKINEALQSMSGKSVKEK